MGRSNTTSGEIVLYTRYRVSYSSVALGDHTYTSMQHTQ